MASRDSTEFGGAEDFTNFSHAQILLHLLGLQHADQRRLHFLYGLVDYAMCTDLHTLILRQILRGGRRTYVVSDHHGFGGGCQHDVRLIDGTHTGMDHSDLHFWMRDIGQCFLQSLNGTVNITFYDQSQFLYCAFLNTVKEVLQAGHGNLAFGQVLHADTDRALVSHLASSALIRHGLHKLTCCRNRPKSKDLCGCAGHGLANPISPEIKHRSYLAVVIAADDRITDFERTSLDQHGCDWSTTNVQLRLHYHTGSGRGGVRTYLLLLPSFLLPFLLLPILIALLEIHLVNGDGQRHSRLLGVIYGFYGLWHHSIVGRHNNNCYVCGFRSPGPHGRKRLMAGSIDERHGLVTVVHLVSTNMLRDPSRLSRRHLSLADGVQ